MSDPSDPQSEPEFYVTDDLPLDYERNTGRGGTSLHGQMSADKVHRLAAARRHAYRYRSWMMILVAVLIVASIKMVMLIVHGLRVVGPTSRTLTFVGVTFVMLFLARRFARRAWRLTRRLRESDLDEPAESPDFTPLLSENVDAPDWHRANHN